ncbi:MAG TPA: hypothetical protein VEP66_21490 [Myxococcales bacterium]|nr:hypothetical protein [Myxococcales bacterium]
MSNTELPRISGSKEPLLSPGHWILLTGAVLTIAAVLGLSAASRPMVPVATRGELAATTSAH